VIGINGTLLSGLATGLFKNTTGTGVPSIATAGTDYVVPSGSITGTAAANFGTDTGAANAYVVSPATAIGATPTDGTTFTMKAIHSSTGASTIAVSGASAIAVNKNTLAGLAAISTNDIILNIDYNFTYNATSAVWVLNNPSQAAYVSGTAISTDVPYGNTGNNLAFSTVQVNSTHNGLLSNSYAAIGTTFTASGCSNGTLVGGATAGSFLSGTTGTCAVTITMGGSQVAAHGWSCSFQDHTTPANLMSQTGAAATGTASMTGTTVSGDLISFFCMSY
jgi:hypothetical protein